MHASLKLSKMRNTLETLHNIPQKCSSYKLNTGSIQLTQALRPTSIKIVSYSKNIIIHQQNDKMKVVLTSSNNEPTLAVMNITGTLNSPITSWSYKARHTLCSYFTKERKQQRLQSTSSTLPSSTFTEVLWPTTERSAGYYQKLKYGSRREWRLCLKKKDFG